MKYKFGTFFLIIVFGGISFSENLESKNFKEYIEKYLYVRSADYLNKTESYKLFLSDTFVSPGGEGKYTLYIIDSNLSIQSTEKKWGVIDYNTNKKGYFYRVNYKVQILGEFKNSKYIQLSKYDDFFIDIIETDKGPRINGDFTIDNIVFITKVDFNKYRKEKY